MSVGAESGTEPGAGTGVGMGAEAPPARRRPARATALAALVFALLAVAPFAAEWAGGGYLVSLLMKAMLLAIAAVSLDLLVGHGGLVSFGHAAFVALGAYATGIALEEGLLYGPAILALALGVSALFALATGAVSLRTSGVQFIMITLAFGQMAFFTLSSLSRYGGDDGLTLWSSPELHGAPWLTNGGGLYLVTLAALAGAWWLVNRVALSRFGRVLRAAKENPTRVEVMGFSVYRYRLAAYVLAGTLAGLAGFLSACHAEFVSPASAAWQRSGELIAVVVLGGLGTPLGPILGALFFVLVEEALSRVVADWRLVFGPLLVAVVLFTRGGLAGLLGGARR